MKYHHIIKGTFVKRINRFVAQVLIDDKMETVHVKNTGRLKELLVPDAKVILEQSDNPNRKTRYSLIGADKNGILVNIDSQVPNTVVFDALKNGKIQELNSIGIKEVKREVTFGNSRFDLYFCGDNGEGFIEVKGVTLEKNGIAMFPDAPTSRGAKHILEMIEAVKAGYIGILFFLVQMQGCHGFAPHSEMDKPFTASLEKARRSGVDILVYDSVVGEGEIEIGERIPF